MKINVTLIGDREVVARMQSIPARARVRLTSTMHALAIKLRSRILQKLSGEVLNVRTGNLRRSIQYEVTDAAGQINASVFSAGDVKYAAIHEFGGTIDIPEITPVKAKALHFMSGGKDVFAMRARAHTVTMPERSFMRSSLAEQEGAIREALVNAVRQVAGERP